MEQQIARPRFAHSRCNSASGSLVFIRLPRRQVVPQGVALFAVPEA
jgi:hypothetical protein